MKKAIFYTLMMTPLALFIAASVYLIAFTNLLPVLYLDSIRNIYFDCMEFVPEAYVYKMKPGECRFSNIEFDTVMMHDADGFRNRRQASAYDVVAIGDSHTQGWGVADDQTFSAILEAETGYSTRNLGIASYATTRELDALSHHGSDARYVIIQYCNNDFSENLASLKLSKTEFVSQVERGWKAFIRRYEEGKAEGYKKPIHDLAVMITQGSFTSLAAWRRGRDSRDMNQEALVFAQIIARYRELLQGKRIIVFEAADFGVNSSGFAQTFGLELTKLDWLNYKIIDTTKVLSFQDYYFLDGHPKPIGHKKLAAAFAQEISVWERSNPSIKR